MEQPVSPIARIRSPAERVNSRQGRRFATKTGWFRHAHWPLNCTAPGMMQSPFVPQQNTRELRPEESVPILADFTLQNRGAHARIEVLRGEVGYQVQTENRPFEGISADVKGSERSVWITLGSTPSEHLSHGVHNVTVIRLLEASTTRGAIVEVESQDGSITVLELTNPEAYALPPAGPGEPGR